MDLPITFDRLGFRSASAFVIKDARQIQVGFVDNADRCWGTPTFSYFGTYDHHLNQDEIPSPEQVISEYNKQLDLKGISCNNEIRRAG